MTEHLLNEISTILNGHGYRAPGAPEPESKSTTGSIPIEREATLTMKSHLHPVLTSATNPSLIRLALVTLQTFNWHGSSLHSIT